MTKTSSSLYPEEEYRHQKAWLAEYARAFALEKQFPFLGKAPTATWFSTSEACEQDFGVRNHAEIDFDLELKPLYAGFLPDGRKLRRLTSVRQQAGKAKSSFPVQAFDLTFSAPKCMSLIFAAAMVRRDSLSINALRTIQNSALEKTLRRFRNVFVHSRSGAGGKEKLKGGEIITAVFTHFDARPTGTRVGRAEAVGDPQLHTHVYLLNTVRCLDGKYRALDAGHFLGKRKKIGLWFRSYIGKLLRMAGFRVLSDPPRSKRVAGEVVISGISEVVESHFSRRSAQIQEFLGDMQGPHLGSLRCEAAIKTRRGKNRHRVGPLETWTELLKAWMKFFPPVRNHWGEQLPLPKSEQVESTISRILAKHGGHESDRSSDEIEELILSRSIGILDPDDMDSAMKKLEAKERPEDREEDQPKAMKGEDDVEAELSRNALAPFKPSQAKRPQMPELEKAATGKSDSLNSVASVRRQSSGLLKYFLERDASEQFDIALALAERWEVNPGEIDFLDDLLRKGRSAASPALSDLIPTVSKEDLLKLVHRARSYPEEFSHILSHIASGRELLRTHGVFDAPELDAARPETETIDGSVAQVEELECGAIRSQRNP